MKLRLTLQGHDGIPDGDIHVDSGDPNILWGDGSVAPLADPAAALDRIVSYLFQGVAPFHVIGAVVAEGAPSS